MIRADGVQLPVVQTGPERVLILLFADGRAHDEFEAVALRIAAIVQREILRTGLQIDLLTAGAGAAGFVQALRRGKMHYVGGALGKLRDAHQPRDGFGLHRRGA